MSDKRSIWQRITEFTYSCFIVAGGIYLINYLDLHGRDKNIYHIYTAVAFVAMLSVYSIARLIGK